MGALTGAQGQGSQAEAPPQPPQRPPAVRDSTKQAAISSGRHRRHKREAAVRSTRRTRASDTDPNTAEADKGTVGGSGVSPVFWPPSNAHPGGSELRVLTGPQATRGRPCQKEPALARKGCGAERRCPGGTPQGHLQRSRGAPGRQHPGASAQVRAGASLLPLQPERAVGARTADTEEAPRGSVRSAWQAGR